MIIATRVVRKHFKSVQDVKSGATALLNVKLKAGKMGTRKSVNNYVQAKRKEAERKGGDALENFREVHQYKSLMKGLEQCRQAGLLGQDER